MVKYTPVSLLKRFVGPHCISDIMMCTWLASPRYKHLINPALAELDHHM